MYVLSDASSFLLTVLSSFLTPRQDLWGCVFRLQMFPILLKHCTSHVTLRPFSPLSINMEINHREAFQALSAFWRAAGTGTHACWALFPSFSVSVNHPGSKRFALPPWHSLVLPSQQNVLLCCSPIASANEEKAKVHGHLSIKNKNKKIKKNIHTHTHLPVATMIYPSPAELLTATA